MCAGCGENYIGETKTKLCERMTLHGQHIRDSKYCTLLTSAHIVQCTQNKEINFVFPSYKMTTEDDDTHRANEDYFIKKFKPALNST